jgi:ribosomal protein S18 acetylase RimI-like enzyme
MEIRKAALRDLDQLANLFDQYRVFYKKSSDIPAGRGFLQERMTNKESEIFVAINTENQFMGFVQLYPIFSSTRMKRLWLLNDLYVAPEYRGQGISVGLIEKAKELCHATNACGLLLETAKTNTVGNQLYPRTDFILESDSNFYVWNLK